MELCQLEDLGFIEWSEKFQLSTVTHLSSHASDHLPIVLKTQHFRQQRHRRERWFKFEESWLLWNDCEFVVKEAWGKARDSDHGLASIKEKIKTCGAELMA